MLAGVVFLEGEGAGGSLDGIGSIVDFRKLRLSRRGKHALVGAGGGGMRPVGVEASVILGRRLRSTSADGRRWVRGL